MWALYRKEISQYFSSLSGIIAIAVFLVVNGLVLFVFEDNLLDFGYATLDRFFELSPWILLLLIPAITMRSFAEEFRTGTWEVLRSQPLTLWQLMLGKYLGALFVVVIALLPTFFLCLALTITICRSGTGLGCYVRLFSGALFFVGCFYCNWNLVQQFICQYHCCFFNCTLVHGGILLWISCY